MGSAVPACQRRDPSGVMAWQAREWFLAQRQNLENRDAEFSARIFSLATGINVSRLCREEPTVIGIGPVDKMVMFFDPESHPLSQGGEFVVVPQNPKGALEMAHMMLLSGMPEEHECEAMVLNAAESKALAEMLLDLRKLMEQRKLTQALGLRTDIEGMVDEGISARLDRLHDALAREQQTQVVVGAITPRIKINAPATAAVVAA